MNESFFSTKGNRILGAVVLVMGILALASWTILNLSQAEQVQLPATITVEGEGEVMAVPDVATFSFSVETEGVTAEEAQGLSAETTNELLAYLEEAGVSEEDIQTRNYNLYPKYRFEERICPAGSFCPPGERIQDGFSVSQSVSVKVRETAQAGTLIAGVGERGATNISGLSFTIDDEESLRAEARALAIEDAREKAEVLADNLDVSITGLASYYENEHSQYGYGGDDFYAVEARNLQESMPAPDLAPGEEETVVRVSVTYEVR